MICEFCIVKKKHALGDKDCLRELVFPPPRKISCEKDRWIVKGEVVTSTSLFSQRAYAKHSDGTWSCPKDHTSLNSLTA